MTRLWEKGLPLAERVLRYTAGEDHLLDARLVSHDVRGSVAHAEMLAATGGDGLRNVRLAVGFILMSVYMPTATLYVIRGARRSPCGWENPPSGRRRSRVGPHDSRGRWPS